MRPLRRTLATGTAVLLAATLCQVVTAGPAGADTVTVGIDGGTLGRTYEGVGAVFSNGMNKLLMDYPPAQRDDILDLLFTPKFGASLQHVKIEIGSDANTSAGTEPSHTRSATDFDITRGTQLWLAQQARLRNPDVPLDALRWGTPAYVDTDAERYRYYKSFLDGAADEYGLDFDYLGPERNEHTTSADWGPTGPARDFVVDTLRPGLDADGYADVKLTAADSNTGWWIADRVTADPALKSALHSMNVHYNQESTANARNSGLALWNGEDLAPFRGDWVTGPLDTANRIIRSYAVGRMTKYEMHPAIEAGYPNTPFNHKSIMVAQTPWSGHYSIETGLWVTAHFTQFAEPGWKYVDSATTVDSRGGVMTVKDPAGADWSTILLNTSAAPRTYQVTLSGGITASSLSRWQTTAAAQFVQQPNVAVSGGTFSVTVPAYSISSLTTTTGQRKGTPAAAVPTSTQFPLDYTDNFDSYAVGKNPRYTSDQGGAFEIATEGSGRALEQVITASTRPVDWKYRATPDPYTLLGSLEWRNYEVEVDAKLTDSTGYLLLGGRVNHTAKSAAPADGYDLRVDAAGNWALRVGGNAVRSGTIAGFAAGAWHTLRLRMHGTNIKAFVDSTLLTEIEHTSFASGQVVLGSGYHRARFDNLAIRSVGSPVSVTRYTDDDPRLRWTGTWLDLDGNYDTFTRTTTASRRGGDELNFSFHGSTASIIGARGVDGGRADVYVDGVFQTTIDTYATAPEYRRAIFQSPSLPTGNHTIRLVVKGTGQAPAVDTLVRVDAVESIGGTGLLTPGGTAPARTVVHDTFDAYPTGTVAGGFLAAPDVQPLDWTAPAQCVVAEVPSVGDKSFVCTDTSTTGAVEAVRDFPRTGSGTVTVEYRFKQDAVGRWTRMNVGAGPVDNAIELYDTDTSGLALRRADDTYVPLGTITPDTWYVVRLVIDTGAREFDAYLNGTPVLSDQAYTNPTLVDVDRAKFRTGNSPTVVLALDYVSVTVG
ncbi:hypothetical protein [Polymorphospora rubra]|uniref:galactosylceramidase n=1 Tax=Polymorphospora rubra TaxID=338584 RepID=A0A810MS65_9ACTN|nr:hypothetical protein [Polymorphospora rubra]BCJ64086.1 hypothetical protein Prubr_11070 [Polymorphospora rubra]